MSLPSLGSSSPAQKQRNQQLALAVFFLRRLPWARPRSSSFGFGASLSLPSCRSRAESPWILVVFYTLYMDSSEELSYEEEEEVLFWDDVILEDDNIDKEDYEFEDKDEHALEEIVCIEIVYDIE
ncbi:uncharacterized protein LOC107459870 isoform X4 [Arachis duranensis]|uniref:Uncharacterized protein LOC107459870 isoform X4 n=1 Tax=Arachis duranensis TaxID=130453 RepID=A0A6P4BYU5_ARADU|nr:uncharacterized protein LOC107459870 isoform X4 [Arachis duranensis]